MKRFLLFMGATYYPGGGWIDFVAGFDAAEEAVARLQPTNTSHPDWAQVVDQETGAIRHFHVAFVSGSDPHQWEWAEDRE